MASREELLADPRSGVTQGAARGGAGARHGQHDEPEPRTEPLPPAGDADDDRSPDQRKRPQPPGARPPGPASSRPRSSPAGPPGSRTATVTQQGAGLLVAAFAWPIGVNLLKGGPGAMWGWIKAKFINQPYAVGAGAPAPVTGAGGGHPPGGPRRRH